MKVGHLMNPRIKRVSSAMRKKIYVFQKEPLPDKEIKYYFFILGFLFSVIITYLLNFIWNLTLGASFFKQFFDSFEFLVKYPFIYFITGFVFEVVFRVLKSGSFFNKKGGF